MSQQVKLSVVIAAAFAVIIGGLFVMQRFGGDIAETPVKDTAADTGVSNGAAGGGGTELVRPNSHVLGERGTGKVTFVEFLDFECESCRAVYPAIEELRKKYQGRVTFVARYFPLPGHFNAERAARAVEAAAQQGKFEDMYHLMYTTQKQWGEQRTPKDDLFLSYAEQLGLDMAQYQRDYQAKATLQRVQADIADGKALGVQGTPTFFVNGKRLEPQSYADLTGALDAALADAN